MNRIRDMRGGKDYNADFGSRMHGEGLWADMIRQRFEKTLARLSVKKARALAFWIPLIPQAALRADTKKTGR